MGIDGAGILGGVGVGIATDTAELDTEASGTYSRDSPLLVGVSSHVLGATAPGLVGIGGAGTRGGVGDCLSRADAVELDAGAPGSYPRDSLDSPSFRWVSRDSLGATAPALI